MTQKKILLGTVSVPSGALAIADPDMLDEEDGLLIVEGLEPGARLSVFGVLGEGGPWVEEVSLEVAAGETKGKAKKLGSLMLGSALLIDRDALDEIDLNEAADGLADLLFWGGDAEALAKKVGAMAIGDKFGWRDLPEDEAFERAETLEEEHRPRLKFVTGVAPHSLMSKLTELATSSPSRCAHLEHQGAELCYFMVSISVAGSDVDVKGERDAGGKLLRIHLGL